MTWLVSLLLIACGGLLFWNAVLRSQGRYANKAIQQLRGLAADRLQTSGELRDELKAMTQQRDDYRKRWLEARRGGKTDRDARKRQRQAKKKGRR